MEKNDKSVFRHGFETELLDMFNLGESQNFTYSDAQGIAQAKSFKLFELIKDAKLFK